MTVILLESFNTILLTLSPMERWQAARRFDTDFMTGTWFTLTVLAILIILIILLIWVTYSRIVEERKVTQQLFVKHAEKSGLSERERKILLEVVKKSGLKRRDAIFTMEAAFQQGSTKMIEESLSRHSIEKGEQLGAELAFLCEKLGFQKQPVQSTRGLDTRQLLIGKKLYITRRLTRRLANIESIIIKNTNTELTVQLAMPVESMPGSFWRGRYYSPATIWEFDTSTVSCSGNILVLNHSSNIRLINRRRFPRVPVNKPAFIAYFPFSKTLSNHNGKKESSGTQQESAPKKEKMDRATWTPPKFNPATVKELAGPGLRIETKLNLKTNDKALIAFRLDIEEQDQDSNITDPDNIAKPQPRIVEAIGIVRQATAIKNGFSIAIELVGLSSSEMNELVCATNAVSMNTNTKEQNVPNPDSDMLNQEKDVAEPAAVQAQ